MSLRKDMRNDDPTHKHVEPIACCRLQRTELTARLKIKARMKKFLQLYFLCSNSGDNVWKLNEGHG
ncbi:hypothetical protein EYF80_022589 [Liparis tanakae]|uniref:Uncharacterized protein n=1 Tax=Liparis tanakae TaxID=230148 RepID=A0A4Z2HQW4_9TELE|nr:hypothetical protein EYF80_022589 [Liparis tanakae]